MGDVNLANENPQLPELIAAPDVSTPASQVSIAGQVK